MYPFYLNIAERYLVCCIINNKKEYDIMDKKIIVTVFLWQLCVATLHATTLQDISVNLGQPESEINITLAKFMIDEVMDPVSYTHLTLPTKA